MSAAFEKLLAIMRRDLLTATRYGAAFWFKPASVALELAGMYYLARAIGPGFRPDGVAYFPFLLIGTAYVSFLLAGVSTFVESVQESQMTGTIEVLMTTATPAPQIVLFTAISSYGGALVMNVIAAALGLALFELPITQVNLAGLAIVFLLSVTVAIGIGMFAAGVQLAIQKGGALVWLIASISALLTGTMFPVSALPTWLQKVAAAIPITHALNGLRQSLLKDASLADMAGSLIALALSALVLVPLGIAFFSFMLRRARRLGTLSFY